MKNESKILIIEDDMLLNDMTKRLLTQHGYCATSAYSGSEALLLIERSSFDLILLDLMLPGIVVSIIALAVCLLTALHGVLSDGLKGLKQRSKSIGISFLIYAVAFLLFIFFQ